MITITQLFANYSQLPSLLRYHRVLYSILSLPQAAPLVMHQIGIPQIMITCLIIVFTLFNRQLYIILHRRTESATVTFDTVLLQKSLIRETFPKVLPVETRENARNAEKREKCPTNRTVEKCRAIRASLRFFFFCILSRFCNLFNSHLTWPLWLTTR